MKTTHGNATRTKVRKRVFANMTGDSATIPSWQIISRTQGTALYQFYGPTEGGCEGMYMSVKRSMMYEGIKGGGSTDAMSSSTTLKIPTILSTNRPDICHQKSLQPQCTLWICPKETPSLPKFGTQARRVITPVTWQRPHSAEFCLKISTKFTTRLSSNTRQRASCVSG